MRAVEAARTSSASLESRLEKLTMIAWPSPRRWRISEPIMQTYLPGNTYVAARSSAALVALRLIALMPFSSSSLIGSLDSRLTGEPIALDRLLK